MGRRLDFDITGKSR